jgi:hypothetical protein
MTANSSQKRTACAYYPCACKFSVEQLHGIFTSAGSNYRAESLCNVDRSTDSTRKKIASALLRIKAQCATQKSRGFAHREITTTRYVSESSLLPSEFETLVTGNQFPHHYCGRKTQRCPPKQNFLQKRSADTSLTWMQRNVARRQDALVHPTERE